VTQTVAWVVESNGFRTFYIPTPKPPFRVEVTISPTFVPSEVDPSSSESRAFGAQVNFDYAATLPKGVRPDSSPR
jgi:hypothetical protein